jgi:hypothetical protein
MALFQAICGFTHLPRGFRNRDLRTQVEALWGRPYSAAQMTYDLRRLRLKGLIHRIPNTHRYTATSYGLKVAFFNAKLYLRIFRPNWPALLAEDDPFSTLPPGRPRQARSRNPQAARGGRTCCLKNLLQPLRSSPLEMSLEIRRHALGELHPDYAESLNNLAVLHDSIGDYTAAESLFRRASAILRQALGELHPNNAQSGQSTGTFVFCV